MFYDEKINRVIERAASNVLRKTSVCSVDIDDLVQEGWLYIAEHPDWYERNRLREENVYRRMFDRLKVIAERDSKKRSRETSLEALEEDAIVVHA